MLLFTLLSLGGSALALATRHQKDQPNCVGINAISPKCKSSESAFTRDFFYIGGVYAPFPLLKSQITINQMYVEKLTPIGGANKPYPIVLFTAGVPSGAVRSL